MNELEDKYMLVMLDKGLSFFSICNQGSGNEARALPTGQTQDLECGLIISSIGYKSLPIDPTVPFDPRTSTVPNEMGRVSQTEGKCKTSVGIESKQSTSMTSCIPNVLPDGSNYHYLTISPSNCVTES